MFPATIITDEITAFTAIFIPISAAALFVFYLMLDRNNAKLLDLINGKYLNTKLSEEKFRFIEKAFEQNAVIRAERAKAIDERFAQIERHFDFLRDQE